MSIESIREKTIEFVECGFSRMRKAIEDEDWGILIDKHGWLDLAGTMIRNAEERLPYLDVIENSLLDDDELAKARVVKEWIGSEEWMIEKMRELRKEIIEALDAAGIDRNSGWRKNES